MDTELHSQLLSRLNECTVHIYIHILVIHIRNAYRYIISISHTHVYIQLCGHKRNLYSPGKMGYLSANLWFVVKKTILNPFWTQNRIIIQYLQILLFRTINLSELSTCPNFRISTKFAWLFPFFNLNACKIVNYN